MAATVNHVPAHPLNTIRPNVLPPTPQPAQGGGDGRSSAAKAFFALAAAGEGQSPVVSARVPAQPAAPALAPIARAAVSTDPQKIARPGSLFDIRV